MLWEVCGVGVDVAQAGFALHYVLFLVSMGHKLCRDESVSIRKSERVRL